MPGLSDLLELIPYERAVIGHLRGSEPDLWRWFHSTARAPEQVEQVRREILKATYRFDRREHAALHELAEQAAAALGIEGPVALYQSTAAQPGMNAALCFVPGETHVLLHGPLQTSLSVRELRSVLAHELTHRLLWESGDGELLVADQMLAAMAASADAAPSHLETTRRLRLYLEIHADRGALLVAGDVATAVAALVKVQTGLLDASGESYLAQAEELFRDGRVVTEEVTHPEAFIRARALRLWDERGREAEPAIAAMIEGPLSADRLDLPGQGRLEALTRRVIDHLLGPPWARTPSLLAHARLFFEGFEPAAGVTDGSLRAELAAMDPSVTRYVCYVLLDFATADPSLAELPLAAALLLAEEGAFAKQLGDAAVRELGIPRRDLQRIGREARAMVAAAEPAAP